MQKLAALVAHILHYTGLPPEQLFAYADQGDLFPIGRERGPLRPEPGQVGEPRQQIELGMLRYDGVIQIERYPGPGADFAALVASWLMENDTDRDGLEDPELDIELNIRGGDADVQISIEFEERFTVIEDANGNIPYRGRMWRVAPTVTTPVEILATLKGEVTE